MLRTLSFSEVGDNPELVESDVPPDGDTSLASSSSTPIKFRKFSTLFPPLKRNAHQDTIL